MKQDSSHAQSIATTCPYCGVGCGLLATVCPDGQLKVRGDPSHPANFGRLCAKGAALGETVDLEGRLLYPQIGSRRVSWNEALDVVAGGFKRAIDRYGPDAVAFYVSGQLLTEDYYVANKLMKGFIGSGNIDTNSRLCMASAVAGYKRAFGTDTVPCSYEDVDQAELVVLVGSNLAWCHPVLFQRMREAADRRKNLKVVIIDPRRTPTCELADLHLSIKPGTDTLLFNGLLNYLRREDALDWEFLEKHTQGFAAAMQAARASAPTIPAVAEACGLGPDDVARFFRLFACTEKTVTVFSQGINQSSSGTDKVNSIINCHLATGRIGKVGSGPFSITGQPNAMGGREVGGLANTLAAHMDFGAQNQQRMGRFWHAVRLAERPGLKAVDLFRAIGEGRIKAVWIMATNPLVSLPDADRVRDALASCDLVVVSDCVRHTDTTGSAHVCLPAATWGEKDGTVTNSERRISRQRAFREPPGEAKPDWWIVTQVARRLGFGNQFAYETAADIFREHARASGYENNGSRAFDISALSTLTNTQYEILQPVQWPVNREHPRGTGGVFANGRFFTSSGKARFVPIHPCPPAHATDHAFPLILNTGRVRDQWHTMTRTGKSPRLSSHTPEPFIAIHPSDAHRHGVQTGRLARVFSRWGEAIAPVVVSDDQRAGSVFLAMHWNGQYASRAHANAVVNPVTDPISGEPEFKHTPIQIAPYQPAWCGFILSRQRLELRDIDYWVLARGRGCWRYELAGETRTVNWPDWSRAQLGADGDWLDFEDRAAGRYRGARIQEGRIESCLFVSALFELPPRTWLASLFTEHVLDDADRISLLTGRAPRGLADAGPTVCSCFSIGQNTIREAILKNALYTPETIGETLEAGTNCGSCVPELKRLIEQVWEEQAA